MSDQDFYRGTTPTRCIYELIRDKNRLLQIIGHLRFGKHCGYPLCCRLEFAIRCALRPGTHIAVLNHCHPSSKKYSGCESDFTHCKWHAFLGHKKRRHLTKKDLRNALMNDIARGILREL